MNNLTQKQWDFLKNLEYITAYELKDLKAGYTSIDVLLDPDDLEQFIKLGKE